MINCVRVGDSVISKDEPSPRLSSPKWPSLSICAYTVDFVCFYIHIYIIYIVMYMMCVYIRIFIIMKKVFERE